MSMQSCLKAIDVELGEKDSPFMFEYTSSPNYTYSSCQLVLLVDWQEYQNIGIYTCIMTGSELLIVRIAYILTSRMV